MCFEKALFYNFCQNGRHDKISLSLTLSIAQGLADSPNFSRKELTETQFKLIIINIYANEIKLKMNGLTVS